MIALDPRQTRNYILEADRELPEDQQTIFKLKDLDEGTLIRLMDSIEVTRGDEVTNKIDDDLLARLPWTAKMELANAIEAGAKLTEEQEEKSEPSPED